MLQILDVGDADDVTVICERVDRVFGCADVGDHVERDAGAVMEELGHREALGCDAVAFDP